MSTKWMSRLAILVIVVFLLWLATALTTSPQLVITEESNASEVDTLMRGEVMEFNTFNLEGELEGSIKARSGKQLDTHQWVLTESEAEIKSRDGGIIRFFADRVTEDDGTQIIEADPGSRIVLQDGSGLEVESEGPIQISPERVVQSDATARFKLHNAQGRCLGLSYQAKHYMTLKKDAEFFSPLPDGIAQFYADSMTFNMKNRRGVIENGRIMGISGQQGDVHFSADHMAFDYVGLDNQEPFRIREIIGQGAPCTLSWEEGEVLSQLIHACFSDQTGQLEEAQAAQNTSFITQTQDGYTLAGRTGRLTMTIIGHHPTEMISLEPVTFEGVATDGSKFSLIGKRGFSTAFTQGKAASTVVYGEPVFQINQQHGQAGTIRLLHDEGRILLGGGAELTDLSSQLLVRGEEVLLAHWEGTRREVFARDFVHIVFSGHEAGRFEGFGNQMTAVFPDRSLDLKGNPAKFVQAGSDIAARRVQVTPTGDGVFSLQASGQLKVNIKQQPSHAYSLEGHSMDWQQTTGTLTFSQVSRASIEGVGELAAETLIIEQNQGDNTLNQMSAEGHVVFEGTTQREGTVERFSSQADHLHYDAAKGLLKIWGVNRDVIVDFEGGQSHRVRELTYNLNSGRMHADSDPQSFTKTILNIKDKKKDAP